MKAVIILRNGVEINVTTSTLEIVKGRVGKVKRLRFDDQNQIVRYLHPGDIACVLSYPEDEKTEEHANV